MSAREIVLLDTLPHSAQKDRFVLEGPGEYEFKATFQYLQGQPDPSKVIESNVVSFTVLQSPEEEREALVEWKDKDIALAIQDWVVHDADFGVKALNKLLSFLDRFPNSLYAEPAQSAVQGFLANLEKKAEYGRFTKKKKYSQTDSTKEMTAFMSQIENLLWRSRGRGQVCDDLLLSGITQLFRCHCRTVRTLSRGRGQVCDDLSLSGITQLFRCHCRTVRTLLVRLDTQYAHLSPAFTCFQP